MLPDRVLGVSIFHKGIIFALVGALFLWRSSDRVLYQLKFKSVKYAQLHEKQISCVKTELYLRVLGVPWHWVLFSRFGS